MYVYAGNNPVNYVDPTGHKLTTRDNGGAGGSDEEIVKLLIDVEQAVGGEFSSVVAANELGISRDVVEKTARNNVGDKAARFIMLRGDVIGNAQAMIADGWDPATVRSSPTYQMVMSPDFPVGALDYVDLSIGGAQLAFGGLGTAAIRALNHILKTGSPPPGYKGGRGFTNDGRAGGTILPTTDSTGAPITYREWDVNPYQPGQDRGGERFVTGSDGSVYYTNDHYKTFTRIQ